MNLDWLKRLLGFLKFLLRTDVMTFFLLLFCVLLFAPATALAALGLEALVAQYRPWLGAGLLITAMLLGLDLRLKLAARLRLARRLQNASVSEREVLAAFVAQGQRTLDLNPMHPAVCGLEDAGLLRRTSKLFTAERASYTISEPAWLWLQKHP